MEAFVEFLSERDAISATIARRLAGRHYVREPIGMIAVGHGLLNPAQVDLVLDRQRECRDRFGEIAVQLRLLTGEQVDVLVKIQEFRTSCEIAEVLALSHAMTIEDAARHVGAFLTRDREANAMAAQP